MSEIQNVDHEPIQNHMQIDDMLVAIAAIDSEVERYQELKKHRVEPINRDIAALTARKEQMRKDINAFMTASNEKTLKYPGLGTISRRPGKSKWEITDEDKLLEFLFKKLKEKSPEVLERVVKPEPKIIKKELDVVLAGFEDVPAEAAVFHKAETTLAITFEKSDVLTDKAKEARATLTAPVMPSTINYDELAI